MIRIKLDVVNDGNFSMLMKLIANFDPFLATHMSKYANQEKWSISYLSFNTYEQFIIIK